MKSVLDFGGTLDSLVLVRVVACLPTTSSSDKRNRETHAIFFKLSLSPYAPGSVYGKPCNGPGYLLTTTDAQVFFVYYTILHDKGWPFPENCTQVQEPAGNNLPLPRRRRSIITRSSTVSIFRYILRLALCYNITTVLVCTLFVGRFIS